MNTFEELAQGPRVLLVDDSAANLMALEAVLASLDVPTVALRSGKEALACVDLHSFAVAVVDVQMPDMDGFELTKRLRLTKHGRELPVLLVTAIHRDEAFERKGYASGAADYIMKPYDPEIIRARVKAFIDLYRQRDAVRRGQVALRTQERDEAMRRLVAFERIATAVLETNNVEALLVELLAAFIDAANVADSATILLRDGDWLRVAASVGADDTIDSDGVPIGRGFAGLIAAQRTPFEINDEGISKIVQVPPHSQCAIRAMFGVPLLHEGQVLGVAYIGTTRARSFTQPERRLFLAAAERASLAVVKQLELSMLTEVLEEAPAYIAIVNASTDEYKFVNSAMRTLFGANLAGARAADRGFGTEALLAVESARNTGETVELAELRIAPPNGASSAGCPRYVRFTAQPLRNFSGLVDRILMFAIDITPQVEGRTAIEQEQHLRARLLERERSARRAAELVNTAKDEFLTTVSHELRTPLNAILGWASIARSQPDADKERALAVIERNARAQARIVEDVLDFSRMSKGKMRLALGNIELPKIVESVLETVRPAADAKSVKIDVNSRDVAPMVGDAERLQQVVWNLLTNAIKFSNAGGRVQLSAQSRNGITTVSVSDCGRGIEPDFLPHVFEPFRQANGSTTRRHGGLGLGLAIVRQIVHAHGGTIEARSEGLGTGATFFIELPTHAIPSSLLDSSPNIGTSRKHDDASSVRVDGIQVLVIDDDDDSREFMAQALSSRGARVISVNSADHALLEMERSLPDVIVSDIAMPEVDGYEFVQRVRSLPAERGGLTPALAITAHTGKEVQERALESGFQRHTSKPVDIDTFIVAVAELSRSVDI